MNNIVLFGPPGAGKGTQSELLIEKYHLIHISTGDLFRKHLSEGTELGTMAKNYMDQGHLVPDEVVIGMVEDKITSNGAGEGYIFDGFPRTVQQAESLDIMLEKNQKNIRAMLMLEVPKDELIARISNRGKTSGRTDDQDLEKINTRITVYENETLPVATFYSDQGKLHQIEGVGDVKEIFERLCAIIDK